MTALVKSYMHAVASGSRTAATSAFIATDSEAVVAVLNHLRESRNALVHSSDDSSNIESKLFLLKRYVETAIIFHAASAGRFSDLGEVTEFLDLPLEESQIRERLRLLEKASRFRHEEQESSPREA